MERWHIPVVATAFCLLILIAYWTWGFAGSFSANDVWTTCYGHGSCNAHFPIARVLGYGLAMFEVAIAIAAIALVIAGCRYAPAIGGGGLAIAVALPVVITLWAIW